MSTTFDVYPGSPRIPTFEEITLAAERKLQIFLSEFKIEVRSRINVILRSQNPDAVLPIDVEAKAIWSRDEYAWFTLDSVAGGTDAYYHDLSIETAEIREISEEARFEALQRCSNAKDKKRVEAYLKQTHSWSLRRSAGQPALINIAYGFIASAFADLTDGLIYSDDGAWDYQRFPALSSEFDSWYFRPESALEKEQTEWAERCIASLRDDFGSA